ncbi:hypothetical protein [uncultured Zoogloea sp.]|uniref:hypothetical protein n=1 Tax=uncultured Zoogloea sp. TaxID=160237 RepID=UPI0011D5C084|nr:hypothetical protein [uncultured Zoogloea sp.]TXH43984.1 MAG: hypothetical protein E6Q92_04730 [Burkholderiaceae bacterium]
MLNPPSRVGQLYAALWSSPLLSALLWGCWAALRFDERGWAWGIAGAAALLSAAWFGYVAVWSRFGSAHNLWAPWALSAIMLWPASQALAPAFLDVTGAQIAGIDLFTLALHAGSLITAALWHARFAPLPAADAQAKHLDWPGTRINLRQRTLSAQHGESSGLPGALAAGVGSVLLYGWLKTRFDLPERIAIAVIAMNAVSFFVYFGALGQILGQGLRLHQLESRFPGRLFSHEALPQLEAARRDSWPARLFR